MIDWSKSYNAIWRVFRINEQTWADSMLLAGVESASVTRSCSGNAPMLESGSMTVSADSFERGYYRLVLNVQQGVQSERIEVSTMLCDSTKRTMGFGTTLQTVTCNSVLYPAYTERILDGTYVPAKYDCAEYAANLLRGCIKAPVEVEGGFSLSDTHWFKFGIRILEAVWEILGIGGYVMQIDGRGVVHIRPKPTTPALSLDGARASLLSDSVTFSLESSKVPNRYIAKGDELIAIAVNDDPESPVSTVSRGYIYDEVDDSPQPLTTETFEGYARRRLEELSTDISDVRTYTREFWPDVYPFDLVTGTLESIGVTGKMRVMNQSIKCSGGVTVSEQAAREITLWHNQKT